MSKIKRTVPFRMHPTSWGKKGRDYDLAQAEYEFDGDDLKLEQEKINNKYNKKEANANKEPWVSVLNMGVDPENVTQGYFELDWNEEIVKMLQSAGITGASDEDVVNKWFNAVCRTVLVQEGADLDYGLQGERTDVVKRQDTPGQSAGTE